MDTINVTITGTAPLLLHNGRMANPLDEYAQELKGITSKPGRQKTEDDYIAMMRIEFLGSLYYDKTHGVYIPAENIESCGFDGAKLSRRGQLFKQGVSCLDTHHPLVYEGPRKPEQLWDLKEFRDVRRVRLSKTSSMMRCRPRFDNWSVSFVLNYYPEIIDPDAIRTSFDDAGQRIGLGDYHMRFGKFEVTAWKVN